MTHQGALRIAVVGSVLIGGCSTGNADCELVGDSRQNDAPVAVVRTSSLLWEGEQTYIPLYADGSASGLVVVNLSGGQLYGTAIPDSWEWTHRDSVEICTSVTVLRNEVGFPPLERDCASHPITGKELDLDEDGEVDLVETFAIMDSLFYQDRPND